MIIKKKINKDESLIYLKKVKKFLVVGKENLKLIDAYLKKSKNDFDCWRKYIISGGLLAIHDVFPNPKDGGRPPYEIFCIAKKY